VHNDAIQAQCQTDHYFEGISEITMNSVKLYYLRLLEVIPESIWPTIAVYMRLNTRSKFDRSGSALKRMHSVDQILTPPPSAAAATNGILITTVDAHTLTDGPTIFLCEEIRKIGNFYIQQSKIPEIEFEKIMAKIIHNNSLSEKIARLEKQIEDISGKNEGGEKIGGGGGEEKTRMCNRSLDKSSGDRSKKTNAATSEMFSAIQSKKQELDILRRSI
jgi:hypothetical protein